MQERDEATAGTPPLVSVVVPAFNAEPYIEEAVKSVIDQTCPAWELIVVDDGSTDDTHGRIKRFLSDSRIRYIRQANGGPSSARNHGIRLAEANLIAFLDADDYWLPSKLTMQLAALEKYPHIGVCGTGSHYVSPDGSDQQQVNVKEFHGNPFPHLLFAPLADMSMGVIRRSVLDRAGVFDESLALSEDYEFWLRVGMHANFHVIPEPLVCIRTGHASTSGSWQKRRAYFHGHILPRFLNEQGGREFVRPWHLWKLNARQYKYRGDESRTLLQRLKWYARSIVTYPIAGDAYRALGSTFLPPRLVRSLKSLFSKNVRERYVI